METECSVVNCGNIPSETTVFYKFPTTFDTCMQWVQNTGNKKLMQDFSLGGTEVFMEKHICSDHFADQDFVVFGDQNSGIRCQVVPTINLKKEIEKKDMSYKSDKRKNECITSNCTVDPLPVIQNIKEEPNENDTCPESGNNDSFLTDPVPVLTFIKKEPDHEKIVYPSDENIVGNEAVLRPKIERVDIEEVLLPDTSTDNYTDNDESMDMTDGDQFADVPQYLDIKDPKYKGAVRAAVKRSRETEEEKALRREKNKIRAAQRRKKMTPEQRAEWRERNRIQTKERRERESELKKIVRRYNNAIRASIKRSSESPEQRMERRLKDALRAAERRKSETPEEREERLKKDRERITLRRLQLLMSETTEQREARLKRERERMYRKRHGIKEDSLSTETSNDATESQYSDETLQNLSEILSMYPPKVEIQIPEESESGLSQSIATSSLI